MLLEVVRLVKEKKKKKNIHIQGNPLLSVNVHAKLMALSGKKENPTHLDFHSRLFQKKKNREKKNFPLHIGIMTVGKKGERVCLQPGP